jgi:hypothetical protein
VVRPGADPSGFGDPWLKNSLFHDAAIAETSPVSWPSSSTMLGAGAASPVWGSTSLLETLKAMAVKVWGSMIPLASELPVSSKAGSGWGW